MAESVNVKCMFACLKYEQLLSDKYFIETCFSKKYESYTNKEKLRDIMFYNKKEEKKVIESEGIDCLTP